MEQDKSPLVDSGLDVSPLSPRETSTPRCMMAARTPLNRSRQDESFNVLHRSDPENATRLCCSLLMCTLSLMIVQSGLAIWLMYWSHDNVPSYMQQYTKLGMPCGLFVLFLLIMTVWNTFKFNRSKDHANASEANVCRNCNNFPFQKPRQFEYKVQRTFSGKRTDIWPEFIDYFENIADLNLWNEEKKRRVLLTTLRGQASTYVYGLQPSYKGSYNHLLRKMDERFGFKAMKETYVKEARLRRRNKGEPLRDFAQALDDLYRRAYQDKPDLAREHSLQAFLNKCGDTEDFRLAVKRTKPRNISEAVSNAIHEEYLRIGERELQRENMSNMRRGFRSFDEETRYMNNVQRRNRVCKGNTHDGMSHQSNRSSEKNPTRGYDRPGHVSGLTQHDNRANTTKGIGDKRVTDCTRENLRASCRETGYKLRYKRSTRTPHKHPSREKLVVNDRSGSTSSDERNLCQKPYKARNNIGRGEPEVSTTADSEQEYRKSIEEFTSNGLKSYKGVDKETYSVGINVKPISEDPESGSESGYETLTSVKREMRKKPYKCKFTHAIKSEKGLKR